MKGGREKEETPEERASRLYKEEEARKLKVREELAREELVRQAREELARQAREAEASRIVSEYHKREKDKEKGLCTILGGRIKNIFRKKNKSKKNKSKRIKKNKRKSRKSLKK